MRDEKILIKYARLHNHICILYDSKLVRLIGLHADMCDFYYKVKDISGKISYESAVGRLVSLKSLYPNYTNMEKIFNLNHCKREDFFEFTVATKKEDIDMYGDLARRFYGVE